MGQTLDMLLNVDPGKIRNVPTGQVEIQRLSKELGQPFYIKFKAATIDGLKDIEEKSGGKDTEEMKWTVYEQTIDPEFKSKELREKIGVKRPVDIVETLLLGGEILMVYQAILKLSGFNKDGLDIEEVKN